VHSDTRAALAIVANSQPSTIGTRAALSAITVDG